MRLNLPGLWLGGIALRVEGGSVFGSQAGTEFELFAASRDRFVRRDRDTTYGIERTGNGGASAIRAVTVEAEGSRVVANRMTSDAPLPSELLAKGQIDDALAAYRRLFVDSPDDPGISQERMNSLGYRLAGQKELDKAVAILKLNTELRPDASNPWDSLGEISLAADDRRGALEAYRRCLATLQKDTRTDPDLRERLRQNAEAKIRELSEP